MLDRVVTEKEKFIVIPREEVTRHSLKILMNCRIPTAVHKPGYRWMTPEYRNNIASFDVFRRIRLLRLYIPDLRFSSLPAVAFDSI